MKDSNNDLNIKEYFVLLNDVIPNAIYDIRYSSSNNFVGNCIDGYDEPYAILTKKASKSLKKVNDALIPKGYCLKIFDAYRPQQAVNYFKHWATDINDIRMKKYYYPNIDKKLLFEKGYIASKSSHSRGSTVDLTLYNIKTNKDVDMGGSFDYFDESSNSNYKKITEEQYNNRMFLRKIMLSHGFTGIDEEWWHFTLKNEPFPKVYFDFPVNSKLFK